MTVKELLDRMSQPRLALNIQPERSQCSTCRELCPSTGKKSSLAAPACATRPREGHVHPLATTQTQPCLRPSLDSKTHEDEVAAQSTRAGKCQAVPGSGEQAGTALDGIKVQGSA